METKVCSGIVKPAVVFSVDMVCEPGVTVMEALDQSLMRSASQYRLLLVFICALHTTV